MPTLKMVRPGRIPRRFFLVAIVLLCSLPSWSQSWPLPLGDEPDIPEPTDFPCPEGEHNHNSPGPGAKCGTVTITGCKDSNGTPLPAVHASIALTKPVAPNPTVGTIVIFNGGAGTDWFGVGRNGVTYVQKYVDSGFQVMQVMWQWQPTFETWRDNSDHPPVKNLKVEGCRPATLLHYLYKAPWGHNSGTGFTKGMCAQGHSTGATAIAYALAWYGAGSDSPATGYLDHALFTSGPAQADLELGCKYDGSTPLPINVCPAGQTKCGGAPTWQDCAQYNNGFGPNPYHLDCMGRQVNDADAAASVAQFTFTSNPPANCNNTNDSGIATTAFQNSKWKIMSVVSTGFRYDYPRTSVSAFLCASGPGQYGDLPNNSAAQAWQYLQSFTDGPLINVYPVEQCQGTEEIWGPAARVYQAGGGGQFGFEASTNNMITQCTKRH